MTTAYLTSGATEQIIIFATNGIAPVTGVVWTLKIVRLDTGQFWNGTAWQSGVATVAIAEVDSVNRPGEYKYAFTPIGNGFLCSILAQTSDTRVAQQLHIGTLSVGYGLPHSAEMASKYLRNKLVQPGDGTYTVYDDDGVTVLETGTISQTQRAHA